MSEINDLPPGFDGVYRCTAHPDREVVAPIACRRCQECKEQAQRHYAELIDRNPRWRPEHDTDIYGEPIDERRVRKRREVV